MLIVMLALVGSSSTAIAAPQGKSGQCYNVQACIAAMDTTVTVNANGVLPAFHRVSNVTLAPPGADLLD
jgi:hypothetical protein